MKWGTLVHNLDEAGDARKYLQRLLERVPDKAIAETTIIVEKRGTRG
jgi:hypothetical protein